jgi:hypothetical protein
VLDPDLDTGVDTGIDIFPSINSDLKPETSVTLSQTDSAGNVSTSDVEYDVSTEGYDGSGGTGTNYECVVNTRTNSRFKAYTPVDRYYDGNSYSVSWTYHPYSVSRARYVSNTWTFQVEMCFTGGGTSWHNWHQWFNGGSASATSANLTRIGYKWAQGQTSGTSSSTINFKLSAGAVEIGASTVVSPGAGEWTGSTGKQASMADNWDTARNRYRVNAFWQSSNTYIWDGMQSFEGNNGHALWEMPQTGGTVNLYVLANVRYLCGAPYGACESLH